LLTSSLSGAASADHLSPSSSTRFPLFSSHPPSRLSDILPHPSSSCHTRVSRKARTVNTPGWAVDARCFHFVCFSTSKSPSSPTLRRRFPVDALRPKSREDLEVDTTCSTALPVAKTGENTKRRKTAFFRRRWLGERRSEVCQPQVSSQTDDGDDDERGRRLSHA
jgi:hypothetical protein